MRTHILSIMQVLNLAEKLKFELRHSFTSSGRQESVAEHTWRMALMAVLIEPLLTQKVDMARLLKMVIIHDLVEAEARDVPVTEILRNPSLKAKKMENERKAIEHLMDRLSETNGREIYDLWHEFENRETFEAKVANALDKMEAQLQHNEAGLQTWEDIEYDIAYMIRRHAEFHPVLREMSEVIEQEAEEMMRASGVDVAAVKTRAVHRVKTTE